MFTRFTKKRTLFAVSLVAALAITGGAIAYFTSTSGSGTGSGTVGSATAWTVAPSAFTGGPLFPGAGTETGNVKVTNASSGNQLLTTITATIAAPTNIGTDGSLPACTAADFTLEAGGTAWVVASDGQSATYAVNGTAGTDEAGTSSGSAGSATSPDLTLAMIDASRNQNNCQGATANVTYTVS